MPDVSVITSGHDVADARLHREVAALHAAGLSVEVLGLGDAADGPAGAQVQTWQRSGLVARATRALAMARRATGSVLMSLDPDSALAIAVMGRLRARPIVIDVHEDYARLLADRAWARGPRGRIAGALVVAAVKAASRADLTVVADDQVPPMTARDRIVLRNTPYPGLLPEPTPPGPVPTAIYVGDVRASRGLFAMLEALRHAPDWHLQVVGPLASGDEAAARAVCAAPDLRGRVTFHGRQPIASAWAPAAGAWVGLLLLQDTPAFVDAVPSKLYEYLALGLPVITTDLPRSARIVREGTVGDVVSCGSDAQVGEQVGQLLQAYVDDPQRYAELQARAAAAAPHQRAMPSSYTEFADAVARLVRSTQNL